MSTMSSPSRSESPSSKLTVRMMMQGKEVGSIIGKKGDNVKRYREESGAKINISDASCPERLVTITGTIDQITKAFDMMCLKFREDLQAQTPVGMPLPPVTIRLVVPASQCGSLIGKGGSKIKEIRETTGVSVQVAGEMLPNSTERTVTVTGPSETIVHSITYICNVMMESPPKGATIPYRPKPALQGAMVLAGAPGFPLPPGALPPGTLAHLPHQGLPPLPPQVPTSEMVKVPLSQFSQLSPLPGQPHLIYAQPPFLPGFGMQPLNPINGVNGAGMGANPAGGAGGINGFLPRQLAGSPHIMAPVPPQVNGAQSAAEMTIPNELIGCIIGRGGSKINEIRQASGAQIKISNSEEGTSDRKILITGIPETVSVAQYLITTSMEIHKNQLLSTDPAAALTLTSSPTSNLANPTPPMAAASVVSMAQPLPPMPPLPPMFAKPATLPFMGFGPAPLPATSAAAAGFPGAAAAFDPNMQKSMAAVAAKLRGPALMPSAMRVKVDRYTPY